MRTGGCYIQGLTTGYGIGQAGNPYLVSSLDVAAPFVRRRMKCQEGTSSSRIAGMLDGR